MNKWKEEFDKRYVVPFDDGTNDKFINVNPNLIKDFISNLIEQVVEDIPEETIKMGLAGGTFTVEEPTGNTKLLKRIKQQLRDKYLN